MALKLYKDDFTTERRLAWIRSKHQALFRGEVWELSFSEFCVGFWSTEDRWRQRGRRTYDLVLTRRDPERPWDRNNCCILPRIQALTAKNLRYKGIDNNHCYRGAIYYGQ